MPRSSRTDDFCRLDRDRYDYLKEYLDSENLYASVIRTGSLRHFLIRPGRERDYDGGHMLKTLVAHYDRFPGSPGANDNGASVLQLLDLASYLRDCRYTHNCQILLTDGEEIQRGKDRSTQGSWQLGELFKNHGLDRTFMIILDMCGIGDTMIYSTGSEKLTGTMSPREEILFKPVMDLITAYSRGKALPIPEKFSDDLGFLAHNYLTLQVSLVPWKESLNLKEGRLPESWETMHTPWDSPEKLESRSFRIMEGFLKGVSKLLIE